MPRHSWILAPLALTLAATPAAAQTRRFAPTVLRLPASARALGVGDAFVAGRGSEMMFYNPAMLGLLTGLTASVQRYGTGSTFGAVSSTFAAGILTAGVGAQYLDYGDAAGGVSSAQAALETRGPLASSSTAGSLAAAALVKGIRMGFAAKFVEERVGLDRDGGSAFDLGVAKDFFQRTTVGLAVQNLGSALQIDGMRLDLPLKTTLGIAAVAPPLWTFFDLAATAAVTYRRDGEVIPAGGLELSYVPLDGWAIVGRAGARRVDNDLGGSPLTLGAGLAFDRLALDYAYHGVAGGEATHRLGLRVR